MTQMQLARKGILTQEARLVAKKEKMRPSALSRLVSRGVVSIFGKGEKAVGIGYPLSTKVNANIGTSQDFCDISSELEKLKAAEDAGADTVMDLSTSGDLLGNVRVVSKNSSVPVGCVPVYGTICGAGRKRKKIEDVDEDEFLSSVEDYLRAGADFVTVHCAINRKAAAFAHRRVMKIVSRGGAFLSYWMRKTGKENPLYANFDYLIELAKERDVVLSLGDALRPGCIADSNDKAQIEELRIQGKLVKRAFSSGVSVVCEGPGHVPLNQISGNVRLQQRLCRNAPYYVLGPLVTDVAPGFDHITHAIGGAVAAAAGVSYICAVTPTEHLGLPTADDVREGVFAARIAAHAGDIVRLGACSRDLAMSKARFSLDWKSQFRLALDPKRAEEIKRNRGSSSKACSMCGNFCAYKFSSGL